MMMGEPMATDRGARATAIPMTRSRGDSVYESPGSDVWFGEAAAAACAEAAMDASACAAEALGVGGADQVGDEADLCIVATRVLGACADLLRCPVDAVSLRHTLSLARVAADVAADCARVLSARRNGGDTWQTCAASCHRAASVLDALPGAAPSRPVDETVTS